MLDAGILSEDDRVELLDGEIVEMTPVGSRHVRVVNRLNMALAPLAAGQGLIVSVQNPLILDDYTEPEPDLVILQDDEPGVPRAAEALLVVEVSETSLSWDRDVKVPRYARASIPEVWLVDLASGAVEVYTEPETTGHYATVRTLGGDEQLSCGALGELGTRVRDVL